MQRILISTLVFTSLQANGVTPQKSVEEIRSESFASSKVGKKYNNIVKPFAAENLKELKTQVNENVTLNAGYVTHPNAKAWIVVFPGFTEFYQRYLEVMYDLHQQQYSILVLDHRGQGKSGNLGSESDVVHIPNFDVYVKDAELVLQNLQKTLNSEAKPVFALAHSMGGGILTLLLEKQKSKTPFKAAILSAPMHDVNTGSFPEWFASSLMSVRSWMGGEKSPYIGAAECAKQDKFDPANSNVTHSTPRELLKREQYKEFPESRRCRGSNQWLVSALSGTSSMRENAKDIKIPIKIFQASDDSFVDPEGQEIVCKKAQNCNLVKFENSKHELLMEVDEIRGKALEEVNSFFSQQLR